jgi:DeoR family transcriptional regulator of aga operon
VDKHARRVALLAELGQAERLSVEEAADRLSVSAATIRRDFDDLAAQQLLVRTRGGAMISRVTYELPLRYRTATNAEEKRRIGAAAAGLVPPHSLVGINGGTTTTEVARALVTRPTAAHEPADGSAMTIVTNAVNIAHELVVRPEVKVVLTGGVARHRSYELVGPFATLVLKGLYLDVTVLGVNGLCAVDGASADNESEADVNLLLVERAQSVIVVADSSKLGHRAFARICPIEAIGTLVTDTGATDEQVAPFEAAGVRVVRA